MDKNIVTLEENKTDETNASDQEPRPKDRRANDGKLATGVARGSGAAAAGVGDGRRPTVARGDDDAAAIAVRAGLAGRGGVRPGLLRLAGRRPGDGRRGRGVFRPHV